MEKSKSKSKKEKTTAKKAAPKKKTSAKKAVSEVAAKKPVAKKKPAKAKEAEIVQKLRIKVQAYEHKLLDVSVKQIMDTAIRYDAIIQGPTPLPTEKKKYTVNRSTFIYKDSREQYEMKVHKRLIDIINPKPKVIEALTNLDLPAGVSIDVKMI